MLHRLVYTALCVVIPLAWGILVTRIFDWIEERTRRSRLRDRRKREQRPQIDYYI